MTELVTEEEMIRSIRGHLPQLLRSDPALGDYILSVTRDRFPTRVETEDRFTRMLNELARDREAQSRKWEEQNHKWEEQKAEDKRKWEEQNRKWEEQKAEDKRKRDEQNRKWEEQKAEDKRKWDEQNRKWEEQKAEDKRKWDEQNRKWEEQKAEDKRKWDEQNRKWEEQKAEDKRKWDEQNRKWEEQKEEDRRKWEESNRRFDAVNKRIDHSIGALGSRWGLQSERAFRDALAAILVESFGVEVINFNEIDAEGEVFGRPDQVELDVIIKNGVLILCEIKSSMSRSDMHAFERKVRFYERHRGRQANRMIVVSPMIDERARRVGEQLGIEMYPDSLFVPVH